MAVEEKTAKTKKAPKFLGTTFIDRELCKGCGFCIEFCPSDVLEFSKEFNKKGYHFPVQAHEERCNGCDLCGLYCPDFAIFGVKFWNPEYDGPRTAKKAEEE